MTWALERAFWKHLKSARMENVSMSARLVWNSLKGIPDFQNLQERVY